VGESGWIGKEGNSGSEAKGTEHEKVKRRRGRKRKREESKREGIK